MPERAALQGKMAAGVADTPDSRDGNEFAQVRGVFVRASGHELTQQGFRVINLCAAVARRLGNMRCRSGAVLRRASVACRGEGLLLQGENARVQS